MKILVTGAAGFIGSCFVRLMLREHASVQLVNLDKLAYSGNLDNLAQVENDPRYRFVHGDICDAALMENLLHEVRPDLVVHFAAESHVDRSILSPEPVFQTNLRGTFTLLEAARKVGVGRFVHVSTDEVYGSIDPPASADETFPIRPSSPYSASKAGSDLLVLSYFATYKLPVVITRASNNYGAYQFPEKLIPLMVTHALEGMPLPVYGDGLQIRDWLYVEDHCRGIYAVAQKGREGEVYNIGGNRSLTNLEVIRRILLATGRPDSLIRYVGDRPGHDRRYALTSDKITQETGWHATTDFEDGLKQTIEWYRDNPGWVERVRTGEYRLFLEQNYGQR